MKPATPKARKLRLKLEALVERGVNGEASAAQGRLMRLLARWDFNAPEQQEDVRDIFKGVFRQSSVAEPVATLDPGALDVASFVKWAIETRCAIPCLFRDGRLWAQATPPTARQLTDIARSISDSFLKLWTQYRNAPGVSPLDRGNFLLGLYEGMMGEERSNEALPKRIEHWKPARAGRRAVARVAGISLHPYSVALGLGRQIRFSVPLEDISHQLTATIRGEIPDKTT